MNPFHMIPVLSLVLLVILLTVGDEIGPFLKSLGLFADPTHRELMRICKQARSIK